MTSFDVIVTEELEGGYAPFVHGSLTIRFHLVSGAAALPLVDGQVLAFLGPACNFEEAAEFCRRLRANPMTKDARVTIILAEADRDARRNALLAGADDYMTGKASRSAILDRVLSTAILELAGADTRTLVAGDLTAELGTQLARWQGRTIVLRPLEFRLLCFLMDNPGRVFSRDEIISALGKSGEAIDARTVDVWIGRLRSALKKAGATDLLRTVRSAGYVLVMP